MNRNGPETFLSKIESLKQCGCYSLNVFYGEDVGCDDSDVPMLERSLQVIWRPVGVLGSARMLWKGNVQAFLDCDFSDVRPKVISNPPERDEWQEPGLYLWGTVDAVERVQEIWPINAG
jgi:hypothetical protein